MKNLGIFKNSRVIVTGHTGFKGSWLTAWLKLLGAEVMGISLDIPTHPSHYKVSNINKNIKDIRLDIRNKKQIEKKIISFKPNFLFHLAAQSLVVTSYKKSSFTWETNLFGTLNILETLRKLNSSCTAVLVTSDKCYFNKEVRYGYKETDILGGKDPYSASKASAEILIKSYISSFFNNKFKIRIASARAGNVIGGGDWSKNRLIPDCIRTIIEKKNLIIRNPLATRPWQHVLEPVSGYLLLGKKLYNRPKIYSGSWNFGPRSNDTKKVKEVAKIVMKIVDKKEKIKILFKKGSFKESTLLKLNSNKANKKLKWKTRWTVERSIKQAAIWYDSYLNKKDINKLTQHQINTYFNYK